MDGLIGFIADLKVLWKEWDVRTFIVASFVFQLILILIAPFRKRSGSLFIRISTWISYLLADWVAAQAVGLISRATQDSRSQESELFGLWAQFLLLHLGGPDTITALALQDNELWLRTALHLGTQAYTTLGILVRSVRHSSLWIATILMFVVGVIKYLQRVTSLYYGRLLDIDDDPYNKYMSKLPMACGGDENNSLSNASMVRGSYLLFQAYKSLYSDIPLKRNVQIAAREYFLQRKPEEAYRMVAIQLNFMYEAMYTKMDVMHKMSWRLLTSVVFCLQVASFVIWYLWDKQGFRNYDVRVTYALLIGAIALDLIGFVRIYRSDWNIALNKKEPMFCKWKMLPSKFLDVYESRAPQSINISQYYRFIPDNFFDVVDKFLKRRDSETTRYELRLESDVSSIWDFVFEMLTKPCEEVCYELPSGPTNMTELLRRAFPIHALEYNMILRYWHNAIPEGKNNYHIAKYLAYLVAFKPDMMYSSAGKGHVFWLQKKEFWLLSPYRTNDELFPDKTPLDVPEENAYERRMEDNLGILKINSNGGTAMVEEAKRQMFEVRDYVVAEEKWKIAERVLGELLCHAAITCRPSVHAEKLKEGGEFLTFVWLLMVHLNIEARTST